MRRLRTESTPDVAVSFPKMPCLAHRVSSRAHRVSSRVRKAVLLLAVSTLLMAGPVGAAAGTQTPDAASDQAADSGELVITSDFIGVVDETQDAETVKSAGVTITWSGPQSGSIRIIWTSVPVELGDGLIAEHVGQVTSSDLATIRAELEPIHTMRTRSATTSAGEDAVAQSTVPVVLVCSLTISDAFWDFAINSAAAGVFQACTGDLVEQRVKGKLQMKTFWLFHSTKAQGDSGWSVSDNVAISMTKACQSTNSKEWRNKGQGMARSSKREFVTPWYTSDWVMLGCKA